MRSSPLRVEYLLEPRRGIPFARNFACRCSLELGADWLAFIDDDEEALPGWLAAYAMAIGRYDGGVYTGPVRYEMPAEFAGYLQNRGLSRFGDGALLPRAATSNVLLSTRLLLPPWSMQFDTRMAFTGGSDSDFFTRYVFHGGRIVYVNDAQVLEPVIENRLMLSWRLKRQFRSSANRVYTSYKLNGLLRTVVRGAGEILSRFVAGLLRFITLPFCLVSGGLMGLKYAWYHCLRHFAKAFGTLSGLFGIQPRPYWETDGY
jgi:succinoglycan biosynthesis protein ExoM